MRVLRLAGRIVLDEAIDVITIDKDTHGNPLNSKMGGELLFYSGTNVSITSASCQMQINGVTSGGYWRNGSSSISALITGTVGGLFTHISTSIRLLNNSVVVVGFCAYMSPGGGSSSTGGGMTTPQASITAIKLFLTTGTFPAGTVV